MILCKNCKAKKKRAFKNIIETFKEILTESNLIRLFDLQYSKLIPFLPLLKNKDIPDIEKKGIKDNAIKLLSEGKNQRDIITIAKDYKLKYGLIKENQDSINIDKLINKFIVQICTVNLSNNDKKSIIEKIKEGLINE